MASSDGPFNKSVLSNEQLNSVREAFNAFDSTKDGCIPASKLGEVMRNLGHFMSSEQLRDLIEILDEDGIGSIQWEDFLPVMAEKIKEKEETAFYKNLFRMLDKKNKGFIKCEDLRYILVGLAKEIDDLTEDEIDAMIADIDEDGNGEVSFEEFYKLMTSE